LYADDLVVIAETEDGPIKTLNEWRIEAVVLVFCSYEQVLDINVPGRQERRSDGV